MKRSLLWICLITFIFLALEHVDLNDSGQSSDVAQGKLNEIGLAGGADAWAVGDEGVILHYQNHAPEICRAWAEPQTVYAGQAVDLYVSVKDLDGPSDIEKVTVDARSIGGGMVVLERTWLDPDDRRCVLFQGETEVSPLASYGSHRLPAEAVDYDGE